MNVAAVLHIKGGTVYTARPDSSLFDIAKTLSEKKIGGIVVIGEQGSVAGIVTERDLVRAIGKNGPAILEAAVSEIMTTNVVTCDKSTTIDEMMDMMTRGRFRHIPVIEDDALVGIVSIGDVVKHHIAEVEMEVTAMRCYLNG